MKKHLFLLLTVFPCICFAQKQGKALLDSLVAEVPRIQNDTAKGRIYKRIAEEYAYIDTKQMLGYAKMGLAHTTKMRWQRGIGVFNAVTGRAYADLGNYDSSIHYYKKAIAINRAGGDFTNLTSNLINSGVLEQNLASNFTAALKYYLDGLAEAEKAGDKYYMALAKDNIAQVYLLQANPKKALRFAEEGLQLREQLEDLPPVNPKREIASSMSSLAGIYTSLKDTVRAKEYYRKGILLNEETGNQEGTARILTTMSPLFGDRYDEKIANGQRAEKLWNEVNPRHIEAGHNLGQIGMAYLDKYRDQLKRKTAADRQLLALSESYLKKAIRTSDENGDIDYKSYFTGILAELQEQKGDFKNAYYNFRAHQQTQDSLYSQENKNRIAEMAGEREIALRDKQIEINRLELENKERQRLGLLVGVALLAVIGALLFLQGRTRKRTNIQLLHLNTELDQANQVKARFFAILSHDLRSPVANLVNFLNLQKQAPDLLTPDATEAHQKRIADSAEALLETMESMLLWSKSQMQQFKPQTREIAVSDLFQYISRFFNGVSNVDLQFENPSDLTVVTDEDYLRTIMQNLTNNAVKALKNTPSACIKWEAKSENGHIVLSITDNGPGASREQLNALYNDQASIGIKSGLGLHLVRDLAKAISCKITVVPAAGQGTVFLLGPLSSPIPK